MEIANDVTHYRADLTMKRKKQETNTNSDEKMMLRKAVALFLCETHTELTSELV